MAKAINVAKGLEPKLCEVLCVIVGPFFKFTIVKMLRTQKINLSVKKKFNDHFYFYNHAKNIQIVPRRSLVTNITFILR